MDSLVSDLKLSLRGLLESPGFALLTLVILGLGTGVNVAMFSMVDGILFRPPLWEDSEDIVWVYQDSDDGEPNSCSFPAYLDVAAHGDLFVNAGAFIPGRNARYFSPDGENRSVSVNYATSSLFDTLGLRPSIGQWYGPDADLPSGVPSGVVSHGTWQRLFGSDPDIIGRSVRLNGAAVTIVGVGPVGYTGEMPGVGTDFWLSLSASGAVGGDYYWSTLDRREDHWFLVVARMRDGVSVVQVQSAMDVLAGRLANEFPSFNEGRAISVFSAERVRLHPEYDAVVFPVGAVLLSVAGLVLLIACSNLANLLLARASIRGREMAVRVSMGATRSRLMRQLLTESSVISLAGGMLGVVLATWVGRLLHAFEPSSDLPIRLEVTPDVRLLVFALGISVVTGLLFGLAPALRASRSNIVSNLKDGEGLVAERGHRLWNVRNALVSAQVAISIVLLVGAGLLVRSLVNAQQVELGFVSQGLSVLETDVSEDGYEGERAVNFLRQLKERVAGIAGVEGVSWTSRLPVTPRGGSSTLEVEGFEGKSEVIYALVDEDYFETLRVPVLHGRVFEASDRNASERIAVVSEAFARQHWGTSDGVGRRYRHEGAPDSWTRIVGVVGDAKVRAPHESPTPIFYRPLTGTVGLRTSLVARTKGEPRALSGMMMEAIRALDEDIPVYRAETMEEHVSDALGVPVAAATTLGVLSGLAVLLASIGLYAVVAFAVSRRKREVGIRMAVGAVGHQLISTMMRETVVVAGTGIVAGVALALLAAPALNSVLFNVTPADPWTFVSVVGLMIAIVLAAVYVPARRAARMDPVRVLRIE